MTSKTIFFKNSLYNLITHFVYSIIFFIPYFLNKYYLNIHELASLSLAQNYLEFFIYLFYFLRISTVIFVGKAFGAKNKEEMTVGYVKGLLLAFFLGLLASIILQIIPIQSGNSPLVISQAKTYVEIASLGFPFVLMNFINFGIYLALQKRKIFYCYIRSCM